MITGLTFSPDGNFMFSSCLQGTLALYSSVVPKSHVLRVLGKPLELWVSCKVQMCRLQLISIVPS